HNNNKPLLVSCVAPNSEVKTWFTFINSDQKRFKRFYQILPTLCLTDVSSTMDEICRLCLNKVNRKRTTIMQSEFRRMMESVFSYSIINKEGLPMYVCTGCSSAVRNFFSYSLKVQHNQRHLERQFRATQETITSNPNARAARKTIVIKDSFAYLSEDDAGEEVLTRMDTDYSSTCSMSLDQKDPLFEMSATEHSSHDNEYEADSSPSNQIEWVEVSDVEQSENSDHGYSCDECDLKLSSKLQLYKHRRVHQKKACSVCSVLFRTDKLKEHFARMHPAEHKLLQGKKEFRCANCQELFKTEAQLNKHLLPPNRMRSRSTAVPDVKDSKKSDETNVYQCTKQYKCCRCEEKFIDKAEVAKHQRLHRKAECPMCGKILRTDKIKPHIAMHHPTHNRSENELYKCVECKKLFENASQLAIHRATHTKQVCPVRTETANSSRTQNHLQAIKSNDMSEDSDEYSDDMDEVTGRSEKQPIQCDTCNRTFLTKYQLQKHERMHRKKKSQVY
uniref:C2H2-type domain-containing protein n=1 Tax=Anopheles minimus TaxID=112268 RepID=A0A182WBH3_9DIPT